MERSELYMWGERGIVATFFADMHVWANADDWAFFLESISIAAPNFPRSLDEVAVLVEPDFGNKGFGHPDAVVALKQADNGFVLIFEAKRKRYCQSCGKKRGEDGYNSTLKGQLELNYILAVALSAFRQGDRVLAEPEWIARTPYAEGRKKGQRAILKSPLVLNTLVSRLAGLPLTHYFHVALTTDKSNPFDAAEHANIMPEVYGPGSLATNLWATDQRQFGWVDYDRMCALADRLVRTGTTAHAGLFADSFAINKPNLSSSSVRTTTDSRSKKSIVVYAPEVNPTTLLHCSYQNSKCKLRDYSRAASVDPIPDEQYSTEKLLSKVVLEFKAARISVSDTAFWHEEILRLNAKHLSQSRRIGGSDESS